MISHRDIKDKARRDLHQAMRVPALFIPPDGSDPTPIFVRDHTKVSQIGAFAGGPAGMAVAQEMSASIVFLRGELFEKDLDLKRGVIVSIAMGEAYKVDTIDPPYGITVTATVKPLSAKEAQGLPVPEVL